MIGCGDLGQRAGARLKDAGFAVTGSRRNPDVLPDWIEPLTADYGSAQEMAQLQALAPDYLIATQVPSEYSVDGYRRGFSQGMANILAGLGGHCPRFTIMVSSTRVYASGDGNWVDEDSPLALDDPRALAIIEAEQQLMQSGLPAAVVRFGGIYGDERGRLLGRIARGEINGPEPVVYGNRIHRNDAGAFLAFLLTAADAGRPLPGYYTGVDDTPAPRHEVETWIASQLGIETHELSPPETSPAHKRCRNTAMRGTGFELQYPTYQAGYSEVLSRR
ncbi:MAG: hypothetical protein AAGI11_11660 [Pseudomonadota bacterium]